MAFLARRRRDRGYTMTELMMVAALIAILVTLSLPGIKAVKRRNYESRAVGQLAFLAMAQKRYYGQFREFGRWQELVDAGLIPRGYRQEGWFVAPGSASSVRPYIELYSLRFTVPSTPNSLYFKIDAVPARDSLGLRTFNISLILDNDASRDTLITDPPVREGLSIFGPPVAPH